MVTVSTDLVSLESAGFTPAWTGKLAQSRCYNLVTLNIAVYILSARDYLPPARFVLSL